VDIEPLTGLPKWTRAHIEAEAERLASFLEGDLNSVSEPMRPTSPTLESREHDGVFFSVPAERLISVGIAIGRTLQLGSNVVDGHFSFAKFHGCECRPPNTLDIVNSAAIGRDV
jgi:hypothetical protein